jgi:hypothetical protein
MKNIKRVEIGILNGLNVLIISLTDGFLILNNPYTKQRVNNICTDYSVKKFYSYDHFKNEELLKFQNILLSAYVYSHDKLEMAVNHLEAIDTLKKIKKNVLLIRSYLRDITTYIDNIYPENSKEFKEDQV